MNAETEQQRILELLEELRDRFGAGAVTEVFDQWVAHHTTHDKEPQGEETVSALTNCYRAPRMRRRCKVEGCEGRVYAEHFYCTVHRLRLERTGDPTLARKRGRKPKGAA